MCTRVCINMCINSNFSDNLYGTYLTIALMHCYKVWIFLSTTATDSPAPVLSRMIPRLLNLLLNSVCIALSPTTLNVFILSDVTVLVQQ
jgi:hypothetical protein